MKNINWIKNSFISLTVFALTTNVFASPTVEEFLKEIDQENQTKNETKPYKLDEYAMSPLSNYMTRDQYKDFKKSMTENDRETNIMEGKVITFNTADKEGCEQARIEMNLGTEVCEYKKDSPMVSVIVTRPVEDREYFEKKIDFSKLSEKEKIALKSVADFGVLGAGMFGIIYSLPESVSKWDKSMGFSALAGQYKDRIKAGPVIDQDDWAVNYIGHPISGAMYYTMVRHQGFSRLESAAFSFCMSTFFWEYGLEAIAEVPSIQDLILTPLIGSIIGEIFYSWDNAIENNGGKLMGSKSLGKTARVLMNPAGSLANQINKVAKYKLISSAELSFTNRAPITKIDAFGASTSDTARYMGIQLKFKF